MNKNQKIFGSIKKLHFPAEQFALFGSAPMGARDLKECRDVDIIVTTNLWNMCLKTDEWKMATVNGRTCLRYGDIELWKEWHPGVWDIKQLIASAELINGLPFVTLDNVIKWKTVYARVKDIADILLIKKYQKEIE